MRIALLHPTYWPEVRRGAERIVNGLATWLAGRGHDVTVLTTHRAARTRNEEDGVRVVRSWRPPDRLLARRAYEDYLATVPIQSFDLLRGSYDVAHAFHSVSAWAALQAQRRGGPPVVFTTTGITTRGYLVARRYRMDMNLAAAADAAACSVFSEAAAVPFERYLLRKPEVIPPGVDCKEFALDVAREPVPTIAYTGSLSDPRKRVPLLLEAFIELRRRRPDARLVLAGKREPWLELELPAGAEFLGRNERAPSPDVADPTAAVPELLARAWVAVLPSVEEGFGVALVEALAAGTPVVAARSGAGPEIVTEGVGRLFEPDSRDGLVAALDEALEMADAAAACRQHAQRWDWSVIGPRYEGLELDAARAR
jgi:phosphatidylinositol alpha-mannosyltransferase